MQSFFLQVKPLLELVPDAKYPLELINANLNDKDCWGPAVKGCTYVFHVASPFPVGKKIDESVIVAEAVGGVVNVLAACAESGTVKRVVLTSSVAAVSCGMGGIPGYADDYNYTEEDWSVEDSCAPYEKSKLKAERAGRDFVDKLEEGKKFELVVVNPGYIQGPLLSAASGSGTASVGTMLLERKVPAVPNICFGIVDVRDVVAGEIAAMFTPSAAGKRFILNGGTITFKDLAIVVRNEFQTQGYNIPTGTVPKFILWGLKFFDDSVKATYPGLNKKHTWSNERMKNELGVTPRPIEKSIIDTCYSIIEFGLVTKAPGYLGPPESRNKTSADAPETAEQPKPDDDVPETVEAKPSDDTPEPKPSDDAPETTEPRPDGDVPETAEAKPSDDAPEPKPSGDAPETTEPKPDDNVPETVEAKPSDDAPEPKPSGDAPETTEPKPDDNVPETAEAKPSDDAPETAEPKPEDNVPETAEAKPSDDSPETPETKSTEGDDDQ